MIIKSLIVLVLLLILGSLASGLYFMMSDKGKTERAVKALTIRIVLSIALFSLLMIGMLTGVIEPHGIYPQQ